MIKKIILLIAVMIMTSLTAYAGYTQTNSGFTVTTIALDAANIDTSEGQIEEDANASVEGDASEK